MMCVRAARTFLPVVIAVTTAFLALIGARLAIDLIKAGDFRWGLWITPVVLLGLTIALPALLRIWIWWRDSDRDDLQANHDIASEKKRPT